MGRPPKYNVSKVIQDIDNYFFTNARQTAVLKPQKLISYLQSKGHNIQEYDLRKNDTLKEHLKNLKTTEIEQSLSVSSTYKTIDADEFIQKNRTPQQIKTGISLLNEYYENIYNKSVSVMELYKKTEEKLKKLDLENKNLYQENCEMKSTIDKLNIEIRLLRKILKTNVYPEIANVLLAENGLLQADSLPQIISEKGKEHIITEDDSIINVIKKIENSKNDNKVVRGLFENI